MRACVLVRAGCGVSWPVVTVVVIVGGGVAPRCDQVEILAKVLSSQELPKKSSLETNVGNAARLLSHNGDACVAGIVT